LDESPIDEQSSTTTAAMAGGNAALQLLATQRYSEADRALQLVVVARPTASCSLLLRQWPTALQLAVMADSALQPWPTLRCNVFVFLFFFTQQLQERKRER